MYNQDYYSNKPKVKLFFDIETIPAEEKFRDLVINLGLQKENKKNKTKIKRLSKSKKQSLYEQSAISGDFGRILCIGYAIENGSLSVITGPEADILKTWWTVADKADLFIGHNIMDFDLRFIFKRSIVHHIKPCARHLNLSFARYKNFPIYDTMREWEKWNPESFIKLDTLAKVLNLESSKSDGIDGSQVFEFYKKGKLDAIYEYCKKDVKLTREVYERMSFTTS